jgi:3-oxoadipate enol-lactonase
VPLGAGDPATSLAARLADRGRLAGGSVAPVRRLVTTASGVRIFCVAHRVSDDYVVMIHGAGGDHLAWTPQLPALHAAGLSTLLLDLRGHGYSDRPPRPEDYRLERFAEDLADVLEAVGVRSFILVGHCFGGMVATIFHSLHPDRSKGYLLMDTAAEAPAALAVVANRTPFLLSAVNRLAALAPDYRQRIFQADMERYKGGGDRAAGRLLSDVQHTRLGVWINVFAQGVGHYDGVAALRSMTQPVWVAVGADDTVFTVADAAVIQSHVPGSKLITVAGANHIIVVNHPEVVERLILDFVHDHAIFGPTGGRPGSVALPRPDDTLARAGEGTA